MADRYWVGNSGNWNDTSHWSDVSGGSSGFSVPTSADAVYIDSASGTGTVTLDVNAECISFEQYKMTFDANDFNITTGLFSFFADTGLVPTVIMGSGTWDCSAFVVTEANGEVVTITPETSTIKITSENELSIWAEGKTFNNIWFTVSGIIYSSNTFNDLKIDAGLTVLILTSATVTVSSFTATGTAGNLITLNTVDSTGQFTISKSSGTVNCDYLDLSNSNAAGGATWNAGAHSLDTTNNDGWIFSSPPVNTGNMFAMF